MKSLGSAFTLGPNGPEDSKALGPADGGENLVVTQDSDDPDGRLKNRRVEIIIRK
jgi:hypothetical protein